MHATAILGYAFNGADYCPTCTRALYARGIHLRRVDYHDLGTTDAHDLPDPLHTIRGEQVAPLFACAEYEPDGVACDRCGREIVEPRVDDDEEDDA
jgi:hypothetical protein